MTIPGDVPCHIGSEEPLYHRSYIGVIFFPCTSTCQRLGYVSAEAWRCEPYGGTVGDCLSCLAVLPWLFSSAKLAETNHHMCPMPFWA